MSIMYQLKLNIAHEEVWFLGSDYTITHSLIHLAQVCQLSIHSNIQQMFSLCLLYVKFCEKHWVYSHE